MCTRAAHVLSLSPTPARRPIANANASPPCCRRLQNTRNTAEVAAACRKLPTRGPCGKTRSTSASCVRRKEPPHCPGLLAQASAGTHRAAASVRAACRHCRHSAPSSCSAPQGTPAQSCCGSCKVETPALPALPAPSPPPVSSCPLAKRPQLSPYPKPLPPYPDEASLRHTPRTPMRPLFPDVKSYITV